VTGQRAPWWAVTDALEPYRCRECGGLHCYWCGRALEVRAASRTVAGLEPSREHLNPRASRLRNHQVPGKDIVLALARCNGARGHARWTPHHEGGPRDRQQSRVAFEVSTLVTQAVLEGRIGP
jgi:hypothetical protein